MSLEGMASSATDMKVLRGKVRSLSPYAIDKTLSVEGASADAWATGEALKRKVGYDDIVDDLNTQNVRKALSANQGVELRKLAAKADSAANEAKSTAETAKTAAGNANTAASNAQTAAGEAKTAAETAQTAAETAQTAAETAQTTAETAQSAANTAQSAAATAQATAKSKLAGVTVAVNLPASAWTQVYTQVANVEGVTADTETCHVFLKTDAENRVECIEQGEGTLTFRCKLLPKEDIEVEVLVLVSGGENADTGDSGSAGTGGGTGVVVDAEGITLTDKTTGKKYTLYIDNGELYKVAESEG